MLRRINGYGWAWDRETEKTIYEGDTFTCNHCHYQTRVKPFCHPEDAGGYCRICDHLICKSCAYLMRLGKPCTPMMEKFRRLEKWIERGGSHHRDILTFGDD